MTDSSPRYTHGHHEAVLRSHRSRTVENSAAYVMPHLAPGVSILDVGCGPGTITLDFAARVAPGRVVGVDSAAAAIDAATAEAASQGATNVEFAVADLYALEFADDTFDIVHAHQVLQHVPDPVGALREMRRVCKPGGIVAARDADYAAFTWYPADPRLNAWQDMYRAVAQANQGQPDAGRYLLSWAHAAGFADATAGASTWCYATPDTREWWGRLWADRITESAVAAQAVELGVATAEELRHMADAWLAWAAEPDGWYAVLHGEILAQA
jgi:ubiquinone/menaquinone biosynthesis C-methylase UbiE